MSWWKRTETKENPAAPSMIMVNGMAAPTSWENRTYFTEAYQMNVIVFRAINEITTAIGNLELELHFRGKALDPQQFKALLPVMFKPNPNESWDMFIRGAFVDYLCTGEIFLSGVTVGKNKLQELWRQTPVYMKVEPGRGGIASEYVYDAGGVKTKWPVDPINGSSDMFFYKSTNPLDYWRGQSPLKAAGLSVDTHNAGLKWNYSLLKNGARPSGVLKFKDNPAAETLARIKEFFKKTIQGSANAGEIPIMTGGAEWQEIGTNPKDMDYLKTMKETAKYVASALGVPLPLIDNDASTFNNVAEAKERFYIDTVIPLFNSFLAQLNPYLQKYIGDGYEIKINMDAIPALEAVRNRKFERMVKAVAGSIITIDEARAEMGFAPIGGVAATLLVQGSLKPIELAGVEPSAADPSSDKEKVALRKAGFSEDEIAQLVNLQRSEYKTLN